MCSVNSGFIIAKQKSKYLSVIYNLARIFKFLIGYWIVCICFIFFAPYLLLDFPDIHTLCLNFIGVHLSARVDYVNVAHGWYVAYYVILLLIAPFLIKYFEITNVTTDAITYIALIIGLPLLPLEIKNIIWPIVASVIGYMAFKYSLFVKLRLIVRQIAKKPVVLLLAMTVMLIVFCLRHFFSGYNVWWRFDGIYAFVYIAAIISIVEYVPNRLKSILVHIGSIGMFLWFTHSIFAIGPEEVKQVLYAPYYPILILAWGIILCWIPSLVLSKFHKYITKNLMNI